MAITRRQQPVKRFLALHDITTKELAEEIGCDLVHLRNVILGRAHPTSAMREALSDYFGMPIEVLIEPRLLERSYRGKASRGQDANEVDQ